MSYRYANVDELEQSGLVGSHHCVALVQEYAHAPSTGLWKEGKIVKGNLLVTKGTAIATFVKGRYESLRHGNHAALYLRQDGGGIWVMDQWKGDPNKPKVSKHYLRFRGKRSDGSYVDPSNNGDAFSVIES